MQITKYTDYCIVCGKHGTERHHIFKGVKQRALAEQDGLVVHLCPTHHRDTKRGVHGRNTELNTMLMIIGQLQYEKQKCASGYSEESARESFRLRYGKNYL